jgi:hypothetical protein
MDLNGTLDELAFTADFTPRQRRSFSLTLTKAGEIAPPPSAPRTDAANWKRINQVLQAVDDDDVPGTGRIRGLYRFDGVGWESEVIAYRLYLDERNAVDIQGKRKPGLYWKFIGSSEVDYQQDADWGMDVLHVGPALGVGGIGFWLGDSVVKPVTVDRQRCRIVARGPVRAIVRVEYTGWLVGSAKADVSSVFTIYAGDRVSEHTITLQGGVESTTLATGIVKHASAEATWDDKMASLYTLGPQSRANDDLFMALSFAPNTVLKKTDGLYDHLVLLRAEEGKPLRFLISAVWRGETGSMWSEIRIQDFLRRTSSRLNAPLKIEIL